MCHPGVLIPGRSALRRFQTRRRANPLFLSLNARNPMKKSILLIASLLVLGHFAGAQSKTFKALQNKFADSEDAYSFKASGFWARTILWIAGEEKYSDAIREIKSIRIMSIPKEDFLESKVTVKGFKKFVLTDSYEEIFTVKEPNEEVTLYIQEGKNGKNRYFMLVDEPTEVVAIEIAGYVDVEKLSSPHLSLRNDL
jgi:hypothetical protein